MIIPFNKRCATEYLLKQKEKYALRKNFEELKTILNDSKQNCKCDDLKKKLQNIESKVGEVF